MSTSSDFFWLYNCANCVLLRTETTIPLKPVSGEINVQTRDHNLLLQMNAHPAGCCINSYSDPKENHGSLTFPFVKPDIKRGFRECSVCKRLTNQILNNPAFIYLCGKRDTKLKQRLLPKNNYHTNKLRIFLS